MKDRKRGLYIPSHPKKIKWGEKARGLWRVICEKSTEILIGDLPSLTRLLILVNEFERKPSKALAQEIRLLAKQFDLKDEIGGFINGHTAW